MGFGKMTKLLCWIRLRIERAATLSLLICDANAILLSRTSPRRLPMKFTNTLVGFCVLALVALTTAQTKISAAAQFGKPEAQEIVEVPEQPGYSISIVQAMCTLIKTMDAAGLKSKD